MGGIGYKVERNKNRKQISTKCLPPGIDTQPVYFKNVPEKLNDMKMIDSFRT